MDSQAKKLINDPIDVVTEFIEGLVETYPDLQYLDGFPEVKVVLRADVSSTSYDKVAVISGEGSGHEPAHAGFVGEGMLTAAICGDVFVSPTANSILYGIRAVTGPMGCLLIVKNYASDCLNFGSAAALAKSEGYNVEMVIVGDDCALPPPGSIAGRRGLAGTILVHKVAGAAAAAGLALADVCAEAKRASELVGTMGVAVSVCTLPGQIASKRLGPCNLFYKMKLGLGIHGESVAAVADLQPVNDVVSRILRQILSSETSYVSITRGSSVVVMVNGLGTTPVMELMIATGEAVRSLWLEHGLTVEKVYTGSFLTSLDRAGFSISIMKVDEGILQRLDAVTKAPYWPVGVKGTHPPAKTPIALPLSRSTKRDEVKIVWCRSILEQEEEVIREFAGLKSQLDMRRGAKDNPVLLHAHILTTKMLKDLSDYWNTYQSIKGTKSKSGVENLGNEAAARLKESEAQNSKTDSEDVAVKVTLEAAPSTSSGVGSKSSKKKNTNKACNEGDQILEDNKSKVELRIWVMKLQTDCSK